MGKFKRFAAAEIIVGLEAGDARNGTSKPRYFFDFHNCLLGCDEIGEELPNDEAAWREATIFTGQLFKEIDGKLGPGDSWKFKCNRPRSDPLFLIDISTAKLK
jgi:hypothetical protein